MVGQMYLAARAFSMYYSKAWILGLIEGIFLTIFQQEGTIFHADVSVCAA